MVLHFYAFGLVLLALLPVGMMRSNLPLFHRLPSVTKKQKQAAGAIAKISVLIPARDEEASIGACLDSVLECKWTSMEVLVMDDCSTDRTLEICQAIARKDQRLKVHQGKPLPMGWNGKQRACWQLALAANGDWLLFLDADVRLSKDAIPRLVDAAVSSEVDLLSGFPKQITGSWLEKLLIPLMHVILLGYLPLARMRRSASPGYSAGCGQLFLARRSAYMTCEGHKAISNSRHDGLLLPRTFRKQRFKTDIFDAHDLATCRMYSSAGQVVRGLLKNATEGLAHPKRIIVFTVLLGGAAVVPLVSLLVGWWRGWEMWVMVLLAVATVLSFVPRFLAAYRFHQAWLGVLMHPVSVLLFLALQWFALVGQALGFRVQWRGRR